MVSIRYVEKSFGFLMKKIEGIDSRIIKVANKLKKLRIEKGYTSYENFAFDNDLPRMRYWRMEKGTNFTFNNLLKILYIHKISLDDFFRGYIINFCLVIDV